MPLCNVAQPASGTPSQSAVGLEKHWWRHAEPSLNQRPNRLYLCLGPHRRPSWPVPTSEVLKSWSPEVLNEDPYVARPPPCSTDICMCIYIYIYIYIYTHIIGLINASAFLYWTTIIISTSHLFQFLPILRPLGPTRLSLEVISEGTGGSWACAPKKSRYPVFTSQLLVLVFKSWGSIFSGFGIRVCFDLRFHFRH